MPWKIEAKHATHVRMKKAPREIIHPSKAEIKVDSKERYCR